MKVRPRWLWYVVPLVLGGGVWLALLYVADLLQPRNYSEIESGLWMGGDEDRPPRGTEAVINLNEDKDLYTCRYYDWEPIKDAESPEVNVAWLRRMVLLLDSRRRAGLKTYVHCRDGVSRSGLLVVAYEMYKNGWTRDEALAFVRGKRNIVRPNAAFMKLLLEWEDELRKSAE
jgi:hypothetical protein